MDTALTSRACPATLHVQLPSSAQAARQARQGVVRILALEMEGAPCPRSVAEDILLVVSELVTNAVLHADGPYALTFSLEKGRAGIAVSDGSGDLSGHHDGTQRIGPGGRGLNIIRALGADLFVCPSDHGKQVIAVLTWGTSPNHGP
ncbi:ATP-binding protein [Streptomyces sp. IBSNAI002]|uniref:ATP-binding protein n=1 Tax=Streptomyces sp. IBSNAI002 TaxID=3457500 RepID=UPI003FD01D49